MSSTLSLVHNYFKRRSKEEIKLLYLVDIIVIKRDNLEEKVHSYGFRKNTQKN
jgi:hypothetical protein